MANIEQGTVTVNEVTFDWWTTGTDNPVVTASNPSYGRKSESVGAVGVEILARALAKELLAAEGRREQRRQEKRTVILKTVLPLRKIRATILHLLRHGHPHLGQVAEKVGITKRTLQRRLSVDSNGPSLYRFQRRRNRFDSPSFFSADGCHDGYWLRQTGTNR